MAAVQNLYFVFVEVVNEKAINCILDFKQDCFINKSVTSSMCDYVCYVCVKLRLLNQFQVVLPVSSWGRTFSCAYTWVRASLSDPSSSLFINTKACVEHVVDILLCIRIVYKWVPRYCICTPLKWEKLCSESTHVKLLGQTKYQVLCWENVQTN